MLWEYAVYPALHIAFDEHAVATGWLWSPLSAGRKVDTSADRQDLYHLLADNQQWCEERAVHRVYVVYRCQAVRRPWGRPGNCYRFHD